MRSCRLFSECVFWWVVVSDWLSGLCGLVGRLGLVCARETGIPRGSTGVLCVGGFLGGVGVYKEPPGAWCSTGGPCDGECGGVLLSHILSGAVPSPCQALASGFGMGSGRLTWAMAAANLQFFFPPIGWGMVPGGGPGTGGWTRCFVVPRFVTMRSLSPGMPHAAVGAW